MTIAFNNWYNLNDTRKYPLDDQATLATDAGDILPDNLLADLQLWFPSTLGSYARLSSIIITDAIVTGTIVTVDTQPNETATATNGTPLATFTVTGDIEPYTSYQLLPMQDGVAGWVVFGTGITEQADYRLSDHAAGFISPKAQYAYNYPDKSGIRKTNDLELMDGYIQLTGNNRGVVTAKEYRTIDGEQKACAVIKLDDEVLDRFLSDCFKLAGQDTCDPPALLTINGISPDENGDITIEGSDDGYFVTAPGTITLESDLNLLTHCASIRNIPDSCGNIPGTPMDSCTDRGGDYCLSDTESAQINSFSTLSTEYTPGESVSIRVQIENTSAAGLSTDTTCALTIKKTGGATVSAGSFSCSWLPSGSTATYSTSFILPTQGAGTATIYAVIKLQDGTEISNTANTDITVLETSSSGGA